MAFIVKSGGKAFTPPPAGPQSAVCCDVVDLGEVTTPFLDEKTGKPKIQHQVRLVFQSEHLMADGKPYMIAQQYNATLGGSDKPSKLREHLETWRGRPFTEQEAEGFDLERLIGVNCYAMIQHVTSKKGNVFGALKAIMPALKGIAPLTINGYTRVKDRATETPEPPPHEEEFPPSVEPTVAEDDIPF